MLCRGDPVIGAVRGATLLHGGERVALLAAAQVALDAGRAESVGDGLLQLGLVLRPGEPEPRHVRGGRLPEADVEIGLAAGIEAVEPADPIARCRSAAEQVLEAGVRQAEAGDLARDSGRRTGSTSCHGPLAASVTDANALCSVHGCELFQSVPAFRTRMLRNSSGRPWPSSFAFVTTWTCRCGPVERPELPAWPRIWPAFTRIAFGLKSLPLRGHTSLRTVPFLKWA